MTAKRDEGQGQRPLHSGAGEALVFRNGADPGVPEARGLYDPALDKDSCGVGFIADIKGRKSHKIVEDGLRILCNLEHRGATGADPRAGDGAGILVQIPQKKPPTSASSCRSRANTRSAICSCRMTKSGGRSSATSMWR
jgi:hypothetical protein